MEGGLQGRQFHQADDRLRDWEGPAGDWVHQRQKSRPKPQKIAWINGCEMMWITAKKKRYVDVRYSPIPEKDGDWDWERWGLSDVKQQTGEQLMQIEAFHRELYKLPVITIWWCGSAPCNHEWIKPEPTARDEKKWFQCPKTQLFIPKLA